MFTHISLEEINPCIRAVGIEELSNTIGQKRKIYDYELIYCHKGSFKIIYENKEVTARQGDMLINPPNQVHQLDYSNALKVYWVHFDFTYIKGQDDISRYISRSKTVALSNKTFSLDKARNPIMIKPHFILPDSYSVHNPTLTDHLFRQLLELYEDKPFHWVLRTKYIMLQLLEDTFEFLIPYESDSKSLLVASLVDYLQENTHRRITMDELSNRFHYHKDTLNRMVKKETGMTIREHMKILKAEKVLSLVQSTDLSLDEISDLCGFTDRSHLIKTFKTYYHKTPIHYRSKP